MPIWWCKAVLFFTKYIYAPCVGQQLKRRNRRPRRILDRRIRFPQRGPPYFRILDLPREVQILIFEYVTEPWSLKISTHEDSCIEDFFCSINFGRVSPGVGTKRFIKCHTYVSSMLRLQLVHSQIKPLVLEVFQKRYEGKAMWSACGDNFEAAMVPWRPPEAIEDIIQRTTREVSVLGVIRPCQVKRLFPIARIVYHVQGSPMRAATHPRASTLILRGLADFEMIHACRMILTGRWQGQTSSHRHFGIEYVVCFYTHILPAKDEEVIAELEPTRDGLSVKRRWIGRKDALFYLWVEDSPLEKVKTVWRTKPQLSLQ